MKKSLLMVLVVCVVSGGALFAQDWMSYAPSFDEGDLAVQAGIGLISTGGFYGSTTIPPVSVSADYAYPVADLPLSFGGFVGFSASEYTYYGATLSYTYILIGARAAYHVDFEVDNLDTYAGIMLGYNIVSAKWDDDTYASFVTTGDSYLVAGGYLGARYFFSDNIAAFGEIGYGLGLITLGATMTF